MKKLLLLFIPLVFFFGCEDENEENINGCTDNEACNYNSSANTSDGSCWYAEAHHDCDGCLNTMSIDDTFLSFSNAAMREIDCVDFDDKESFCVIGIYLMEDGLSLEEFEGSYKDPYTNEVIQYSYWDFVGNGDLVQWRVYVNPEYSSLTGTYELAEYAFESGVYISEDCGYAYNYSGDGPPTAFFVGGTLTITETTNGFYNIDFNHQDSGGWSVTGCYDSIELIN